jgi:hypothetical protein
MIDDPVRVRSKTHRSGVVTRGHGPKAAITNPSSRRDHNTAIRNREEES